MASAEFNALYDKLRRLTGDRIILLSELADALAGPIRCTRDSTSNLVDDRFLAEFGDELKLHHARSAEPLTKDKFEYALARVLRRCGHKVEMAPRNNPGHDMTIDGERVSLKTQADKSIKEGILHISKFMELGKGDWNSEEDLKRLRDEHFYKRLESCQRIFSLRAFRPAKKRQKWLYELVEIPKDLLEKAHGQPIRMMLKTKQKSAMPGYCTVKINDDVAFELYFDGGTERKLQIKKLAKRLCTVHAEWELSIVS